MMNFSKYVIVKGNTISRVAIDREDEATKFQLLNIFFYGSINQLRKGKFRGDVNNAQDQYMSLIERKSLRKSSI